MISRSRLMATAIGISLLQSALPACAATFNVTRFDDPVPNGCLVNDCSLREAVIAANTLVGADNVVLGLGTYMLTQSAALIDAERDDLDVTGPLSITGLGSTQTLIRTTIPGASLERRIFQVTNAPLTLAQLSLRDGNVQASGAVGEGGCVLANSSRLILSDVRISNCRATIGGAISIRSGVGQFNKVDIGTSQASNGGGIAARGTTLRGAEIVLANNSADVGGGIWFGPDGGVAITRLEWATGSQIAGNDARHEGGGVAVAQGAKLMFAPASTTATLDALLLLRGNTAADGGGGIYVDSTSVLEAARLALHQNATEQDGGGLYALGALTLSDSEFVDNAALVDGGGLAMRGNAFNSRVERSSFAYNTAGRYGGAVSNSVDAFSLRNVSSYANQAIAGGAVDVAANNIRILHLTSFDDIGGSAGSLRLVGNAFVQNSVLSNGCAAFGGGIVDLGGNAQVFGMPSCAGASFSAAQIGLAHAYAGGRFNVVTIAAATSVLRDLASASPLTPVDVRGWLRSGWLVDTGAFEYAALP